MVWPTLTNVFIGLKDLLFRLPQTRALYLFPFSVQRGVENFIFTFFFFEKLKKILPSFLLNNIKTTDPNETKKLSHIFIWILKRSKKKKAKISKKSACGHSRPFWSQIKTVLLVTFLFTKRFWKTLHQNVCLDEF